MSLKPDIQQQFHELVRWRHREPPQHVGQIAEWIDAMPLATGGHAEQHRRGEATPVELYRLYPWACTWISTWSTSRNCPTSSDMHLLLCLALANSLAVSSLSASNQ
jgi:hypothetical protein